MTKLDPQYSRIIAIILREYGKTICELTAARAVIRITAEKQIAPPIEWEYALEQMKSKPGYSIPALNFEQAALRLEQGADEIDLIGLLEKLSKGTPIN